MATIDQTANKSVEICWGRGDSKARIFTIERKGVAVDISGSTFLLTVDSRKDPTDASTQQFSLTGTFVTDGTDGQVQFAPSTVETDIAPRTYYYDIQETAGGSVIDTLVKGVCVILQDITK
jgi:hypothetical protein